MYNNVTLGPARIEPAIPVQRSDHYVMSGIDRELTTSLDVYIVSA